MSSLFQFLELKFHNKLQCYFRDKILTWFITGMDTSVNIFYLLNWIQQINKSDSQCLIFIDFMSAYNTIDRIRLFEILKIKILAIQAAIFNIYLDEFLRELMKANGDSFQFLSIFNQTNIHNAEILRNDIDEQSQKWNLKLNNKKSGLMSIKRKLKQAIYQQYSVINIGIKINYRGSIHLHKKDSNIILTRLVTNLYSLSLKVNFGQRLQLQYIQHHITFILMHPQHSITKRFLTKYSNKEENSVSNYQDQPQMFSINSWNQYQENINTPLKKVYQLPLRRQLRSGGRIYRNNTMNICNWNQNKMKLKHFLRIINYYLNLPFQHETTLEMMIIYSLPQIIPQHSQTRLKDIEFKRNMEDKLEQIKSSIFQPNNKSKKKYRAKKHLIHKERTKQHQSLRYQLIKYCSSFRNGFIYRLLLLSLFMYIQEVSSLSVSYANQMMIRVEVAQYGLHLMHKLYQQLLSNKKQNKKKTYQKWQKGEIYFIITPDWDSSQDLSKCQIYFNKK